MLTEKQRRFADFYLETGNAAEAARRAGYNEKSARFIGSENLTKPYISAYIADQLKMVEAESVAQTREVLMFYTSVMRGEVKDQFGFSPSIADRLNAGKELMKRFSAVDDRQKDALERLDALFEEFRKTIAGEPKTNSKTQQEALYAERK